MFHKQTPSVQSVNQSINLIKKKKEDKRQTCDIGTLTFANLAPRGGAISRGMTYKKSMRFR